MPNLSTASITPEIRNAIHVKSIPCAVGITMQVSFRVCKSLREAIVRSEYYKWYHQWRTIQRIERAHALGININDLGLLKPEEHIDAPFSHVRVGGHYDIWSKPEHLVKDCICCGHSFGGENKICTPCIARIK